MARQTGLLEKGNIDLTKQPSINNPEVGGRSTVYSFSVNLDGKEYLLPRVTPDGRFLSENEAINEFKRSGRHLGAFDSSESATSYAQQLHKDYESGKIETGRSMAQKPTKWTPPPYATPANPKSGLRKAYEWGTTPLTTAPRDLADKLVDASPKNDLLYQRLNDLYGGLGTAAAMYQGFMEGQLQGIGDVASQMTAPFDALAMLTGFGAVSRGTRGLSGANKLRRASQALSAPAAYHGAETAKEGYDEGDWAKAALGVAEAAGGAAGVHFPSSAIARIADDIVATPIATPNVREPLQLGPGTRFHVDPTGRTIDVNAGMKPRVSTEIPYKKAGEIPRFIAGEEGVSDISQRFRSDVRQEPKKVPFDVGETPIRSKVDPWLANEEPSFMSKPDDEFIRMEIGEREAILRNMVGQYAEHGAKVASKEILQNAIDALTTPEGTGIPGGKVDVNLDFKGKEPSITIADNGPGLPIDLIRNEYVTLTGSGKRGQGKYIGEMGVGKTTYLLGAEKFNIDTIAKEPDGSVWNYKFSGTPEEMITGKIKVEKTQMPPETPTGTKVTIYDKKLDNIGAAESFLKRFSEYSNSPVEVNIKGNRYGRPEFDTDIKVAPRTPGPSRHVSVGSGPGGDFSLDVPDTAQWDMRNSIAVIISNRGMFQGVDTIHFAGLPMNMPDRIVATVEPTVSASDAANYPLTSPTRERMKAPFKDVVEKAIEKDLVGAARKKADENLQNVYDNLKTFKFNRHVIHDSGNRYTGDELARVSNSPALKSVADTMETVLKELDGLFPTQLGKTSKFGFLISDPEKGGINIPNPRTVKDRDATTEYAILINPFGAIMHSNNPVEAAQRMVHVITHEFTHNLARNEGASYTWELSKVLSKFDLERQLNARDAILKAIGAGKTDYAPEIQKLLSEYQEARRRPDAEKDLLSAARDSEWIREPGGKKPAPGSRKPDGKGVNPVKAAASKLLKALEETRGTREEQEQMYSVERATRASNFNKVKAEGIEGARKQLGTLRGEYDKLDIEGLGMKDTEVNALFSAIKHAPGLLPFEKARGYTGLFKLLEGGHVPQRNEIAILDQVFGDGMGDRIIEMHGGLGAVNVRLAKTANTMKALRSSLDLSGPLRQGIGLIHRPEWRDAFGEMFKYLGNETYYNEMMDSMKRTQGYLLGKEAGLFIADTKSLTQGEEAFLNSYVHNIPGLRDLVNASERAYTGFLNKLRQDTFNNMIKLAKEGGYSEAYQVKTNKKGESVLTPSEGTTAIANYINNATGRGSLDMRKFWRQNKNLKAEDVTTAWNFEKNATELNTFIWSPRLITSRLAMLADPTIYTAMPKGMRFEAVKSLIAIGAFGSLAGMVGAQLGGKISDNIFSSDYKKVRFGNKVLDPWAGFQQYVVAAARFIKGANEVGPQERLTTVGRFARSKMSPASTLAYDILSAEWDRSNKKPENNTVGGFLYNQNWLVSGGEFTDPFGNRSSVPIKIVNSFVPMFLEDLTEILSEDPNFAEAASLTVGSALGMGAQDYPERTAGANRLRLRRLTVNP